MAEGAVDHSSLSEFSEEHLQCRICCELYTNPKILECLHSFCENCLERCVAESLDGIVCCPLCRQEIYIPGNVANLPTNFELKSMIETIKKKTAKSASEAARQRDSRQTLVSIGDEIGDRAREIAQRQEDGWLFAASLQWSLVDRDHGEESDWEDDSEDGRFGGYMEQDDLLRRHDHSDSNRSDGYQREYSGVDSAYVGAGGGETSHNEGARNSVKCSRGLAAVIGVLAVVGFIVCLKYVLG